MPESTWTTNNYISEIKDHIKIHIEQSAKGARVTVTVDRDDHNIDKAVEQAIESYEKSISGLKAKSLNVDESA